MAERHTCGHAAISAGADHDLFVGDYARSDDVALARAVNRWESTMKLLVIDTDDDLRHVVRDLANEAGCEVAFVSAGDDVLEVARSAAGDVDLVLLDLDSGRVDISPSFADIFPDVPIIPVRGGNYEATVGSALAVLHAERKHHMKREAELSARVSRLEKSNGDLERIVCVDPLTGIANRQHVDTLLAIEWARAARDASPMSLVMLDLDYFHALNERYGHLGGDDCLKRVADAMARCLRRPSDILGRFGGEEFVGLLPNTDLAGACVVAERLRATVEQLGRPHESSRCGMVVTVSAGVATATPSHDRGPETLLAAADIALFRAKEQGRNRICASAALPPMTAVARLPWPPCPIVTAAPFLARRIPQFIESCRADVTATRQDLRRAAALSRELESTGTAFGFQQLIELGVRIGGAADRQDRDEITCVLDELSWFLDHVQVVYQAAVPTTKRSTDEIAKLRA